jgi:hypothetical protein
MRRRALTDMELSAQFWYSVDDLAKRWAVTQQRVKQLLQPHKGHCRLGRRGSHPRLVLLIPKDIAVQLDNERRSAMQMTSEPCQAKST